MNLILSVFLTLALCFCHSHTAPSEKTLAGPHIQSAFEEAKRIVDDAYKYSRDKSLSRVRREEIHPSDILHLLKQPRGDTRSAVRSADYMHQTLRLLQDRVHHMHKRSLNATDLLEPKDLTILANLTGCFARVSKPECRTTPNINKYRTITSVCNNLENPRLGASNTPFARWLPAQYDDGVSEPISWNPSKKLNNFLLPLVRQVSNNILKTTDAGVVNDTEFTHLVTLFGQWNDHDLTFTPFSPSIRSFSNGLKCLDSCVRSEPCFPIPIPPGDSRPSGPKNCIPAFRSAPACGTGNSAFNFGGVSTKREQINSLTAFLDLSQVYGSEEKLARSLRNLTNDLGLMRINTEFTDNGRSLLPFTSLNTEMCSTRRRITNDTNAKEVPCFIAGDGRVDENIALTSLHTLFVREHNRLATELHRINPQWDSETLYEETRKIMGAYTQVFVFQDYLPHILGPEFVRSRIGRYPGYNAKVDPSIANVFATAAYRFAHLAIQPFLSRLDENDRENARIPSVPLFKAFFTPWRIIFEGGIDPLLRGLITRPAKLNTQDHMLVEALRDKLFKFVEHIALDLGSLNMQRGRDHGLSGYNAWRQHCGLSQPRNQQELAQVLNNNRLAGQLLSLYGTPANIDIWLGGVSEPFVPGGRVGPLFACLIGNQFKNIREGDRLWYEKPGVFTSGQRAALQRASLSKIICDNTGIRRVPKNPFNVQSSGNRIVQCSEIQPLDLQLWSENRCLGANCAKANGIKDQFVPKESRDQLLLERNEIPMA